VPKIAPDVEVIDHSLTDERGQLVRIYAPECLGRQSEFVAYFDNGSDEKDRMPASYYAANGYTPVMLPEDGGQVNDKGDRLWKISRIEWQKRRDADAQRGFDLAHAAMEPGNEKYADGRLEQTTV
jgi:hypothetical protein